MSPFNSSPLFYLAQISDGIPAQYNMWAHWFSCSKKSCVNIFFLQKRINRKAECLGRWWLGYVPVPEDSKQVFFWALWQTTEKHARYFLPHHNNQVNNGLIKYFIKQCKSFILGVVDISIWLVSTFVEMISLVSIVVTFILKLLYMSTCTQLTHFDHKCRNGASTEQAGMGSGTIVFDGKLCNLTITDITDLQKYQSEQVNRLNIVGVRRGSCDTSQISIDSETYCIDESVKDTLIHVNDQQMKFALTSTQEESFTLTYYTG